jgi:hypothetical protein
MGDIGGSGEADPQDPPDIVASNPLDSRQAHP